MRLTLIAAALPPALDGIGDYTANLASELSRRATVSVLCGMPNPSPIEGASVRTAFAAPQRSSVLRLAEQALQDRPDAVVLQYCPFSYGRWGINPYLAPMLTRIRRAASGAQMVVTVHEPLAWPINWKLRAMNLVQRPQLRAICRRADLVFCTVGKWCEEFKGCFAGRRAIHLPVGSNMPRVPIARAEARARLGIAPSDRVMAIFGQGHHSQMWEYAAEAVRHVRSAGVGVVLLHIGPRSNALGDLFAGVDVLADGVLPGEEVSRRLCATDVFLAPFADGVSTRRTTLMAALQHGIPTVGSLGYATDPVLANANGSALLLTPSGDREAFGAAALRVLVEPGLGDELSRSGQAMYESTFAWPVLARRMLDAIARRQS